MKHLILLGFFTLAVCDHSLPQLHAGWEIVSTIKGSHEDDVNRIVTKLEQEKVRLDLTGGITLLTFPERTESFQLFHTNKTFVRFPMVAPGAKASIPAFSDAW